MTRRGEVGRNHAAACRGEPYTRPVQQPQVSSPHGDLLGIIGQGLAAVLLVDLATASVVHANPVARQLAPELRLPVGLDDWSDAAGLCDADGTALSVTARPLSLVVGSSPTSGDAVSAARQSELGPARDPLRVIALPMSGAPMLDDHALVVLLPAPSAPFAVPGAGADHARLRDRAVLATGLSFTVADALAPYLPLVWVNPAFTTTTGYSFEEVVGRNCRFLQGPGADPVEVGRMRDALERGEPVSVTLLNHRKDGPAFWNQIDISPIHDADGVLTHFVGIQTDVSGRVDADLARGRALEAERVARAEAEAAQTRLAFLVEAVNRLSGTLDVAECRSRLMDLVIPELADWVLVLHVDNRGGIVEIDGAHRDPEGREVVEELARVLPAGLHRGSLEDLFLDGRPVRRISDLGSPESLAARRSYLRDTTLIDYTARLGGRSAMYVALPGRRLVDDLMILVRSGDRPQFTDADLDVGMDLGRRVGLILDNARLYQVQANIAETLQRSLLPALPTIAGVTTAARYQASADEAEVGGDFFEILDLPDGSVGLAIGDVMGHDVLAAAAMGHLKGILRACAYDTSTSPARVLDRVDRLVAGLGMPTIASVVYAHLVPDAGAWQLTWANAGHPPLVVRHADGRVGLLAADDRQCDLRRGVGLEDVGRRDHLERLEPGAMVIAYTDGLVERRDESLDAGLVRLVAVVGDGPDDVDGMCDHLLRELGGAHEDDIAVLAVLLGHQDPADG
ncbi:hypothetical protein BH11ACT8_BH11ACT8_01360 [soil metagenome]